MEIYLERQARAAALQGKPVKGWKLFKLRKDGSLGPLFINARQRVPVGEWLQAEDHPTKGFAHRPFWHATLQPVAPHLSMNPKGGPRRVWCEVEMQGVVLRRRPKDQGGTWVLADRIKVTKVHADGHPFDNLNKEI